MSSPNVALTSNRQMGELGDVSGREGARLESSEVNLFGRISQIGLVRPVTVITQSSNLNSFYVIAIILS